MTENHMNGVLRRGEKGTTKLRSVRLDAETDVS